MSLREDITSDMKGAMKAGDKEKLATLRLLVNSIKNKEIDAKHELSDAEVHEVIGTMVRQRQDSIDQYTKGGRDDLAEKEEAEMELLKSYLPPQLSEDEVRDIVKEVVAETGASGMGDMGKVMKGVMPKVKGKAEGRMVNAVVKEVLGG